MGSGRHRFWFLRWEHVRKEGTGSHVQPGRANCDLLRGKAQGKLMRHLKRPPELKTSGVATPQVSSVVQVRGQAKAESNE